MYFAVFVVCPQNGGFCATTRAVDRGESGKIGLPGGKVDFGETAVDAAIRESLEEGWIVEGVEKTPFCVQLVEGKPVAWFRASKASVATNHKEAGRVEPITVSLDEIASSGYGNDIAMASY